MQAPDMGKMLSIVISIVTLANIFALVVLLIGLRRRPGEKMGTTQTTGHVWDEDLRELNNPLPRWWLWLFVLTVIFGLGYLVVFPGLGNYEGTAHWTHETQYREQSVVAERRLAQTFAPFERRTVVALSVDPAALRVGRNLFLNNCAGCHGSDARGAPGFPNLTDNDWLFGGTPEAIAQSIAEGRISTMPAWKEALGGDSGVEDVLKYVMSLSGHELPAGNIDRGREKFQTICVACHGADGRGNQAIGAPNLTDQIWLNGGALETVRETIAAGRHAQMPAHGARLGEARVKLLAAYVISLGGAEAAHQTSVAASDVGSHPAAQSRPSP
ncbi:MAG TPA: cytochrome-c oxidase, cbb3-type subunit III [Steroidobacteraceae bacterium]|nr:cytochrome-c oxidase, cbb3-type subunit III [Steroidobacteraceae bacterium]